MDPLLRFVEWDSRHEDHESRKVKYPRWLPGNVQPADPVLHLILDHEHGDAHLGVWQLLRITAAQRYPRGELRQETGKPHTALTLAQYWRRDLQLFQEAIDHFLEIGVLTDGVERQKESAPKAPLKRPHRKTGSKPVGRAKEAAPTTTKGINGSASRQAGNNPPERREDAGTDIDRDNDIDRDRDTANPASSSTSGVHTEPAAGEDDVAAAYVARVKARWEETGAVCGPWNASNERLAAELHRDGVPIERVEGAITWGAMIHFVSTANSGTKDPINSMQYFRNTLEKDGFLAAGPQQLKDFRARLKNELRFPRVIPIAKGDVA